MTENQQRERARHERFWWHTLRFMARGVRTVAGQHALRLRLRACHRCQLACGKKKRSHKKDWGEQTLAPTHKERLLSP